MVHFQLGGHTLLPGPGVLVALADDAAGVVGQERNVLLCRKPAQLGHELRGQQLLIQGRTGGAVHDLSTVVGQDAAALFVQPQFLCQRGDASRRPAGSQHDGHALRRCCVQRRAGAGGNDLFIIGQGAVQIQRQHPNF